MPNRWKVVIASVILFVWTAVYTLWDLLSGELQLPLRDTMWAPSDMKKVWATGVISIGCFVIAIVGDFLTAPTKRPSK